MSQENVEVVRETIEARNRSLDDWLSFFHPHAQTGDRAAAAAGMPTTAIGRDELRRDAELWMETFDDFHMEIVELVDLDELVLAEVRFHGTGKANGAEVTGSQVDLYRVCEGLITEHRAGYSSREEALEAAGLSE